MARRVSIPKPSGYSRWIERDVERGLTLEEAIEKDASRPSARERWDDPERWRQWQEKYAPQMLRGRE